MYWRSRTRARRVRDIRAEAKPIDGGRCQRRQALRRRGRDLHRQEAHILAGNGMEEYVIERLYRDAKLIELGGGTTEIQELTAGRWLMEHYGR
jgi:alkylation response protein AidB-like acyl-CoA dehydrogenase